MMGLKQELLKPMDVIISDELHLLVVGTFEGKVQVTAADRGKSDAATWEHCNLDYFLEEYLEGKEIKVVRPRRKDISLMPRWFYRAHESGLGSDITSQVSARKMTLKEIESVLGYKVEIVE